MTLHRVFVFAVGDCIDVHKLALWFQIASLGAQVVLAPASLANSELCQRLSALGAASTVTLQLLAQRYFNDVRGKNLLTAFAVDNSGVLNAHQGWVDCKLALALTSTVRRYRAAFASAAALLDYVDEQQHESTFHQRALRVQFPDTLLGQMLIDDASAASLELVRNVRDGTRKGTGERARLVNRLR
jgi:DNA mismatch repair ATPase MutS